MPRYDPAKFNDVRESAGKIGAYLIHMVDDYYAIQAPRGFHWKSGGDREEHGLHMHRQEDVARVLREMSEGLVKCRSYCDHGNALANAEPHIRELMSDQELRNRGLR